MITTALVDGHYRADDGYGPTLKGRVIQDVGHAIEDTETDEGEPLPA